MKRRTTTDLLLRLVAPPEWGGQQPDGAQLTPAVWPELVREALRHGLAPLLHHSLRNRPRLETTVPREVRACLADVHLHNRLRNRAAWGQLAELLDALGAAGVIVVALKGADLAERAFGRPDLRPMEDLDLLVAPRDVEAASVVMRELGYQCDRAEGATQNLDYNRHHHLAPFRREGALPVELHRRLHADDTGLRMNAEGLIERAVNTSLAGVPARVLAPPDLLVHLAVHAAANHRFEVTLGRLVDAAWFVRALEDEIDWGQVVARACAVEADRFLRVYLELARDDVGAPIPRDVLRRLGRPEDEDIVVVVREHLSAREGRELPVTIRRLARVSPSEWWAELRRALALPGGARSSHGGEETIRIRTAGRGLLRFLELTVRAVRLALKTVLGDHDIGVARKRDQRRRRIEGWVSGP